MAIKSMLGILLSFSITLAAAAIPINSACAQSGSSTEDRPSAGGPRRQLATIIYAGLGGAIIGLSTLSFYGRPQDKLSNIAIGFAVGVIGGTVAVTWSAATNPDEFYGAIDRERILGPASNYFVADRVRVAEGSASPISFDLKVLSF